jgi:GINS complex subunit 2
MCECVYVCFVSMCLWVYVRVCVNVCECVWMCECLWVCVCECVCVSVFESICVCKWVWECMCECVYVCVTICKCVWIVCIRVCTGVCVCVCVCVHLCIHVWSPEADIILSILYYFLKQSLPLFTEIPVWLLADIPTCLHFMCRSTLRSPWLCSKYFPLRASP